MLHLRRVFLVAENFGVLRQVSRFVRQEAGLTEVDLYERLRHDAACPARPLAAPRLHLPGRAVPRHCPR